MTTSSSDPYDILEKLMSYHPNNYPEAETNRRAAAEIQNLRKRLVESQRRNSELSSRVEELLKEKINGWRR